MRPHFKFIVDVISLFKKGWLIILFIILKEPGSLCYAQLGGLLGATHSLVSAGIAASGSLPRNIIVPTTIVFKNDSTVKCECNYNAEGAIHLVAYPQGDPKPQYEPNDTKFIVLEIGKPRYGIPYQDSVWLFNIVRNKIMGYSRLPFEEQEYSQIRYIRKGDGPILKLTYENLLPMVSDDPRAMKKMGNSPLWKVVMKYNR